MNTGGMAPCVLNAANETAVEAFLNKEIRFTDIAPVIAHCLEQKFSDGLNNLESLLAQDGYARKQARDYINGLAK